jgi:hypothetical protein
MPVALVSILGRAVDVVLGCAETRYFLRITRDGGVKFARARCYFGYDAFAVDERDAALSPVSMHRGV